MPAGENAKKGKKGFQDTPKKKSKVPTASENKVPSTSKKSESGKKHVKKTAPTNKEVEEQIEQAYRDCHKIAKQLRNENAIKINAFRKEEDSKLDALIEGKNRFTNFFLIIRLTDKMNKRINNYTTEVKREEATIINKIYKDLNYKTIPEIEKQYNNGRGIIYVSRDDDDDSYERNRRNHNPGGGARGTF